MTWTEDRATQRCDPSAAPGAKTGVGAGHHLALLPFRSGIGTKAVNLRGTMPRPSGRMPFSTRPHDQDSISR